MPDRDIGEALGYRFKDKALLRRALTHRSRGAPNNERLEFLGDGVLNFVIASLLYERFGQANEGELSRARASLVKEDTLLKIALDIDLGKHVLLGEGELKSGGVKRPSILADTLEALFGAIYLDGGFEAAHRIVGQLYDEVIAGIDPVDPYKDPKTRLQEYLQGRRLALPVYTVLATHGAAHAQQFEVECRVIELDLRTTGTGANRRAAEQQAAERAYNELVRTK